MNLDDLKERILTALAGFPEISLAYLFGSQVSGQVGPMSDDELSERLARLKPLQNKSRTEFDQDPYLRDIVERNLEVARGK